MKSVSLLFSLLLFSIKISAQDTIIKNSGEQVIAKVMEITPKEIKYKRFDFVDGPMYVEKKTNIDFIKFSNGVVEHFEKEISMPPSSDNAYTYYEGRPYIKNSKITPFGQTRWNYNGNLVFEKGLLFVFEQTGDHEIMSLVTKARIKKKQQYIGFGIIPLAAASIAFGVAASDSGNGSQIVYGVCSGLCAVGGVGCIVFDITVSQQRRAYVNKALRLYNERY